MSITATATRKHSFDLPTQVSLNGVIQQRIALAVQHAREGNPVDLHIESEFGTHYLCWRKERELIVRNVVSASLMRSSMEALLPLAQEEFERRLREAEAEESLNQAPKKKERCTA